MLGDVIDDSFNKVTVDGDMSTNDTVIVMANGASGVEIKPGSPDELHFKVALTMGAQHLARAIAMGGGPDRERSVTFAEIEFDCEFAALEHLGEFGLRRSGLTEALPYIQKFRDDIVVIKFGGSAMENPELTRRTMRDIVLLEATGMKPVVVHGGGKAITARLKELNIETKFINGLRVTCEKTIAVVDDVLHNTTNRQLVDGIRNPLRAGR